MAATACSSDALVALSSRAYDGSYCSTSPATCQPVQSSVTGPDGRTYRVDSFMTWYCAVGTLRTAAYNGTTLHDGGARLHRHLDARRSSSRGRSKQVTIVVRDASTTSKTYVRETSVFDQAT